MTVLRSCIFAIAAAVSASSLVAHADTINFTVNGSAAGVSGTGVLTTTLEGSGKYLITGITGPDVSLIAPGDFNNNDNLLFPSSTPALDSQGFSFTATDGSDVFDVNIFNSGTGYFAFFRDEDAFTATVPVTFEVTSSPIPEPATLLLMSTGLIGAVSAVRRRVSL